MKLVHSNYRDRKWINTNDPLEVEFWSEELKVSKLELIATVEEIGTDVDAVRHYIKKKHRRQNGNS